MQHAVLSAAVLIKMRSAGPARVDETLRRGDMQALPLTFLVVGTLGILLFGVTLTPVLDDRATSTIRLRIVALVVFAVGMVTFAVNAIAAG